MPGMRYKHHTDDYDALKRRDDVTRACCYTLRADSACVAADGRQDAATRVRLLIRYAVLPHAEARRALRFAEVLRARLVRYH